jgi:hypothetical protein
VATWRIAVYEDLTDFDGGTDTVSVSYDNALPMMLLASATPVGDDTLFELDFDDPDLAINGLGLVDFELLEVALIHSGIPLPGFEELFTNGSQTLDNLSLFNLFGGDGVFAVEARVTDRANMSDSLSFNVTVAPIPIPAAVWLFGSALGLFGWMRRRAA